MTNAQSTIDLHQYWDVLRARKLAIIIPTLLALALAGAYCLLQKPQYTAQARVLVTPLAAPFSSSSSSAGKANQPDMNTEQATADSTPVAVLTRGSLNLSGANGDHLLNHLQVAAASTGNILLFQYTSSSPQQAAQYANAFAKAYITYRNNTVLVPLAKAIAERQQTISKLAEQFLHAGSAQRAVLLGQLRNDELQLAQFQSTQELVSGGLLIGTAVPPSNPSSPKVVRTLIIAGVVGLVFGICLALIREGMDRRIKSPDELEARMRAPVLGVIPRFHARSPERSLAMITEPRGPASEAYRMTAMTLEHQAAREHMRVIMIASPQGGGGASTTTANLGVVLAQAGHRVILVSGDLRDSRLHLIFGLSNRHGLSTALLEGTDAERLLKEAHVPNLYVLTSGPEPKDPAALLASPATREVLSTLLGLEPDFILVDAPPVLSVSDAVILSRQAEGTVITWNAEDFRAPALSEAQERLETAGANILGGIYAFDRGRAKRRESRTRRGTAGPEGPFVPRETRKAAASGSRAEARYDGVDAAADRSAAGSSRSSRDVAPGRERL